MAQSCFKTVPFEQFWSLADSYPDLVSRLHVQVRLMGNFGLNAGAPWLSDTECTLYFISKESEDSVGHFLLECPPGLQIYFESIGSNLKSYHLKQKIVSTSPADGVSEFINNLDQQQKVLLLLGGFPIHLMIEL